MNWEYRQVVAETVNKWVITAAVIVGGTWTYLTFNTELKSENAKAQLIKTERELVNLKRESLSPAIALRLLGLRGSELLVEVRVTIVNQGMVDLTVPIREGSLRITPITTPNPPGQPTLAVTRQVKPKPLITDIGGKIVDVQELLVPAGSDNHLIYVAQIDTPSRFLVEFSAPSQNSSGIEKAGVEWSTAEVLDVPERSLWPVSTPATLDAPANPSFHRPQRDKAAQRR